MSIKIERKKVGLDLAHLNPYQQMIMDKMTELNPGQGIQLLWELIENSFEHKESEVFDGWKKYSKKSFKEYYGVDIRTFNKWLRIYCKSMDERHSNSKRKLFIKSEWDEIMNKLGWCDGFDFRAYLKIDLAKKLAEKDGVKDITPKSLYDKYNSEINKYLYPEEQGLNIFPPVAAHRILAKILEDEFNPYFQRSIDPPTDQYKANAMIEKIEKILQQSEGERFMFGIKATKAITKFFDEVKEEIEKTKINPSNS